MKRLRSQCLPILIAVCCAPICRGAENGPRTIRESFAIEQDPTSRKRIADIQEYIRQKRWEQAAELLVRLSTERGKSLVPMNPGWYVNVSRRCNLLAASMPAEGLRAYRAKVDRRAKSWLDDGRKTRNAELLRRIVREAFCSSSGDDALLTLGQWAWDAGDLPAARRYWGRLLPPKSQGFSKIPGMPGGLFYPDTDLDAAGIQARVILCDVMLHDFRRADASLKEFRKRFPKSTGRIAGRSGVLAGLLDAIRKAEAQWPVADTSDRHLTFAGNFARNGRANERADVGAPRWTRKLLWLPIPTVEFPKPGHAARHPACFATVFAGRVYVCDADRVYGYSLKDGSPAFPVNGANAKQSIESRSILYSVAAEGDSPPPTELSIGVPYFTTTIHDGRLYARLGSPVAGRAKAEQRAVRSRLVCLDLRRREGDLLWSVQSRSLGEGWEFEGAPVVDGGRLYIALRRRNPETEIHVVCFNANDGRKIWTTAVGTAIGGADGENVISGLLLTLAEGRLFLSTNLGAVAAVDARDGLLQWAVTYPAAVPEDRGDLSDPRRRGLAPCLFHRGRVFAAPADTDRLLAIDADSGCPLWQRRIRGGIRFLIGAVDGTLVASGNQLWGLDAATGKVRWTIGSQDPAGFGFGRGTLADDDVYWPLRKEIFVVRAQSGRIVRRISLRGRRGGSGGNLVIAGGSLIVAEPDRVVVYGTQPARR
jgi:outer membrane protein assembly factor BamB